MSSFKLFIQNNLKTSQRRKLRSLIANLIGTFFPFNLKILAQLYGTDKWGRHFYTYHYQLHLRKFKFENIKLLEIGVGGLKNPSSGGNSLRMWKKYFPFGKIYSVDIFDKSEIQEKRIKIFRGNQADNEFLLNLINEIGEVDIIIDDGSHINEHVINTFNLLFPRLKDGGVYIVEDTETSYRDDYGGDSKNLHNQYTTMNYFKSFPDLINYKEFVNTDYLENNLKHLITSIHFYHNLIVIYKGDNSEQSSNF